MVVVKGNFNAQQSKAKPVDTAEQMQADLGLDNLAIVYQKDRSTIVAYYNDYEGRRYFHVRSVYQKYGKWTHGKGLGVDPAIAKELCTNIGELAKKL